MLRYQIAAIAIGLPALISSIAKLVTGRGLYHPSVGLTKKQRNELFEAVVKSGINAAEFDLRIKDVAHSPSYYGLRAHFALNADNWIVAIDHITSASALKIYQVAGDTLSPPPVKFFVQYHVGSDPSERNGIVDWPDILMVAAEWAGHVKDYVDTPDLWAEMLAQRELLSEASLGSLENTPFTPAERAAISAQLRDIKNYIKDNASLTGEQFKQAEARIDEAEAASRRLGRKDWLLLFLGTTVQLYVTDMVPATVVQHITSLVLQGLGHLFGFGPSLPPIAG
jgi:hypothetical protein